MHDGQKRMLSAIAKQAVEWRRELHRHPQTKYEETFASDLVARKLREWNIPHERGIAGTGVVGTIAGKRNSMGRSIAFRADMDALDLTEESGQPWASEISGKMHGCGHDGHTATLLALACYLARTRDFDGLIRLIFQPAEEEGCGAFRMLEEGLLKRFPFDEIYGFHNWPGLPRGSFAICSGPVLAAVDNFEITLEGQGGHAAFPHSTADVVPAVAHLIFGLQTLVSRETDPLASAVVSVTNVSAGSGAENVITGRARLSGTVRTFQREVRDRIESRIANMAEATGLAFRARCQFRYTRLMDAVVNHEEPTSLCRIAASAVVGSEHVLDAQPLMGGEDFGGFLQVRPGAFMIIGQGEENISSPHNAGLHSSKYDFNDEIIPIAAQYFAEIVSKRLPID